MAQGAALERLFPPSHLLCFQGVMKSCHSSGTMNYEKNVDLQTKRRKRIHGRLDGRGGAKVKAIAN